jgi:hypothetical protein
VNGIGANLCRAYGAGPLRQQALRNPYSCVGNWIFFDENGSAVSSKCVGSPQLDTRRFAGCLFVCAEAMRYGSVCAEAMRYGSPEREGTYVLHCRRCRSFRMTVCSAAILRGAAFFARRVCTGQLG